MQSVAHLIDDFDGFATTRQLRSRGVSEQKLTSAVRNGAVRRVKKGWYSTRSRRDPEFVALQVGGRLTGLSAIAVWHGWVWREPARVQVAVPRTTGRVAPRRRDEIDLHWETSASEAGGSATCVSLRQALVRVILDEPLEVAVACLDWANRAGRLDRIDFEALLLELPRPMRAIRGWLDLKSQSVLESVARVRCMSRGWAVRSQVPLGELEAVDLVIEEVVALELDGREFHESTFDADRLRDARIVVEGRHAIRASTNLIRDEWPWIEKAIEAALDARRPGVGGNAGNSVRVPRGLQRSHGRKAEVA